MMNQLSSIGSRFYTKKIVGIGGEPFLLEYIISHHECNAHNYTRSVNACQTKLEQA